MKVGEIRNIIDYLLIHSRFNFENGATDVAGSQLQWAASFMDLNVGTGKSVEQRKVREAAERIDRVAQRFHDGETVRRKALHSALFNAHRSLARYHYGRAVKLHDASEQKQTRRASLIRPDAMFQRKAGLDLQAALVHFNQASTTQATMQAVSMSPEHEKAVEQTYQFASALQVASGQVDPAKIRRPVQSFGRTIRALG